MDWKKAVLGALVFTVVAQIIHTVGAMAMMDYYMDPQYFCLWSSLMMPAEGPPGTEFLVASLVSNLAMGFVFAGMYQILQKSVPGKKLMKGVNYGIMLFMLFTIPYTLTAYLLLAIPAMLLFAWAAESLVILLLSGAAFAKLN